MSPLKNAPTLQRRSFLIASSFAAAAGCLPYWARASSSLGHNPFTLGVTCGDAQSDNILIWTRLTPPSESLGMVDAPPLPPLKVRWEVAHDLQFRQIIARGEITASAEWGHSVHVQVNALAADRWYFYRFMQGDAVSTTGRARTAPQVGAEARQLRLAVASCQRWEHGFYTAWRQVAQDAPDMVLFLGDYIYEYSQPKNAEGLARSQPLRTARTLQDYRDRYALHKSDAHLQAAHASSNWSVIWDDHEVENDYAAQYGVGDSAHFLERRMAAWQAFYENMPLRPSALQQGMKRNLQGLALYRTLNWGNLAKLHMLDARQYRDPQACRAPGQASPGAVDIETCTALQDPARSFLGWDQERWLAQQLQADSPSSASAARWTALVQTTLFSTRKYPNGKQSTDSWDGYPEARQRLVRQISQTRPRNTVVLGGDIHQNYVCAIPAQADQAPDKTNPVLASEFCATAISSRSGSTQAKVDAIASHNPQVVYARAEERGYSLFNITPQAITCELRAVTNPLQANSSIYTLAQFALQDGRPGPIQVS